MPERSLDGIQITETPGAEQPIARASAHLTAFVGRTLRGPVNRAVAVHSFADFQQEFGGLWQPSPLSYAVEHFFEQGGRQAVIVRVANGAAWAHTASKRSSRTYPRPWHVGAGGAASRGSRRCWRARVRPTRTWRRARRFGSSRRRRGSPSSPPPRK